MQQMQIISIFDYFKKLVSIVRESSILSYSFLLCQSLYFIASFVDIGLLIFLICLSFNLKLPFFCYSFFFFSKAESAAMFNLVKFALYLSYKPYFALLFLNNFIEDK